MDDDLKQEKAEEQAEHIGNLFRYLYMVKEMGLDIEFLEESKVVFVDTVIKMESIGCLIDPSMLDEAEILKSRIEVIDCIIKLYESLGERDKITEKANENIDRRKDLAKVFGL